MAGFPRDFPRRGEIYWAPLDKVRPAVVVSADHGNQHSLYVIVAALTTTVMRRDLPVNVYLPAGDPLPDEGLILCRTLVTLGKNDLRNHRADLRPEQVEALNLALSKALGLG